MQKRFVGGWLSVLTAAGCTSMAIDGRAEDEWNEQIASARWTAPLSLSVPIPPTDVVEGPAYTCADLAATQDAAGTWTAPTTLATNVTGAATGSVDVAIDGAGNAVAVP